MWQFWRPRRTVESVAARLAEGLLDGSVVLAGRRSGEGLVLTVDVPEGAHLDEVFDLAKRLALQADERHRAHGGAGLSLQGVEVHADRPENGRDKEVRVQLRPKPGSSEAAADAVRRELAGHSHGN